VPGATGAQRRRWDLDQVVAAGSALGLLAVGGALLLLDLRPAPVRAAAGPEIARLSHVDGGVRVRSAGTLVWERTAVDEPLGAGDAIFVQPGGAASVVFRAGAVVELEERSLIIIEQPDSGADRLNVLEGSVVAAAGSARLSVQSGGERALVAPGGAVSVEAGEGMSLLEGRAIVGSEEVGASPTVALVSPPRGHRLYVSSFPAAVALRWDGDAARSQTLEVSRERSFATRVASGPGAAGFFVAQVDAAGPWYWRTVGPDGAASSEVRKFVVILDRPPRPFAPAPGEIVLAPQGVQVPFWWTAVAGAAGYRVDVAADAAFQRIELSEPVNGPGLWAQLDLPEGVYFWRVRAERARDAEHVAPASTTVAFRLIHRPILDAPQLFDASMEEAGSAR
jgi:hypothetical protein